MGLGPINAGRRLSELTGIDINDVDVFEVNEAFASQSIATIRDLRIRSQQSQRQRRCHIDRSPTWCERGKDNWAGGHITFLRARQGDSYGIDVHWWRHGNRSCLATDPLIFLIY